MFGRKKEVCKPIPGHCECPPPNCPDCCIPRKLGQKDNKCGGTPEGADGIQATNLLEALGIQGTPVSAFGGNFKFPDGLEKSPKTGFRAFAEIYKEDLVQINRYNSSKNVLTTLFRQSVLPILLEITAVFQFSCFLKK